MRQLGFTLIEVLVVLFIISIATSVALLNVTRNESRQVERVAHEMAQTIIAAKERAMLQPATWQLIISPHAWQFYALEKQHWVPVQHAVFARHLLPANLQLSVVVAGKSPLVISMEGDMTPFTIYVGKQGEKPRFAVTGDADGHIASHSIS